MFGICLHKVSAPESLQETNYDYYDYNKGDDSLSEWDIGVFLDQCLFQEKTNRVFIIFSNLLQVCLSLFVDGSDIHRLVVCCRDSEFSPFCQASVLWDDIG